MKPKPYKKVRFSDSIIYISEDVTLEKELRQYRQSNVQQYKADYFRYKQLLTPILDAQHRQHVYDKYFH